MDFAAAVASVSCLALVAVWFYLHRQAGQAERSGHLIREWIEEMSVERYRPMLRLLSDQDFRFLLRQPGATPALVSRLRTQRYRTFRGYLGNLRADFELSSRILLFMLLRAESCRPGLPGLLVRHRLMFAVSLLLIRWRLLLHRFGMARVDAAGLLILFDTIHHELRVLEAAPQT